MTEREIMIAINEDGQMSEIELPSPTRREVWSLSDHEIEKLLKERGMDRVRDAAAEIKVKG